MITHQILGHNRWTKNSSKNHIIGEMIGVGKPYSLIIISLISRSKQEKIRTSCSCFLQLRKQSTKYRMQDNQQNNSDWWQFWYLVLIRMILHNIINESINSSNNKRQRLKMEVNEASFVILEEELVETKFRSQTFLCCFRNRKLRSL